MLSCDNYSAELKVLHRLIKGGLSYGFSMFHYPTSDGPSPA